MWGICLVGDVPDIHVGDIWISVFIRKYTIVYSI